MGELRNRFKRPAFNGFLTRWDGSGSVVAWRGHLLSGEWCLPNLVVPWCECMEMCCGHGKGEEVKIIELSMQLAKRETNIKLTARLGSH